MNNALEQVPPNVRKALEAIQKLSEEDLIDVKQKGAFDNYKDAIIATITHKTSNSDMPDVLSHLNVDMWALLDVKAEGEAE